MAQLFILDRFDTSVHSVVPTLFDIIILFWLDYQLDSIGSNTYSHHYLNSLVGLINITHSWIDDLSYKQHYILLLVCVFPCFGQFRVSRDHVHSFTTFGYSIIIFDQDLYEFAVSVDCLKRKKETGYARKMHYLLRTFREWYDDFKMWAYSAWNLSMELDIPKRRMSNLS